MIIINESLNAHIKIEVPFSAVEQPLEIVIVSIELEGQDNNYRKETDFPKQTQPANDVPKEFSETNTTNFERSPTKQVINAPTPRNPKLIHQDGLRSDHRENGPKHFEADSGSIIAQQLNPPSPDKIQLSPGPVASPGNPQVLTTLQRVQCARLSREKPSYCVDKIDYAFQRELQVVGALQPKQWSNFENTNAKQERALQVIREEGCLNDPTAGPISSSRESFLTGAAASVGQISRRRVGLLCD